MDPKDIDFYIDEGLKEEDKENFFDAIKLYSKAINIDSDNGYLYSLRGSAYANEGDLNSALKDYNKSLEIDPKQYDLIFDKGNVLFDLDKFEEAIQCFNKFLEQNPDNRDATYNVGLSYVNLGKNLTAQKFIDKALNLTIKSDELYPSVCLTKGQILFNFKEYQNAISYFEKAIRVDPEYFPALFSMGLALQELKKPKGALNYFDRALKIDPDDLDVLNSKGSCLIDLGKIEESILIYDKIIKIDNKFIFGWYNKGIALRRLKKPEEALKIFEKAISIDKEYEWSWYGKANVLKDLGHDKEALKAYKIFVDVTNKNKSSDAKLTASRVKDFLKQQSNKGTPVTFKPSEVPTYWQWVTKAEFFLETDGREREDLEPTKNLDVGGYWTCHKNTNAGDLTFLYRAGKKGGKTYQDIKYLILATSDAYPIGEDEFSFEHGWDYGCDYKPLFKFQNSLSLKEIRKDPHLQNWNAYKANFNGSAYKTDPQMWKRINEILIQKNPEYKEFLKNFRRETIIKDITTEKEVEENLAKNIHIMRKFGYDLEVEGQQVICKGQGGYMDILCKDKNNGNYVVIELKITKANRNTFGQISDYMGWVINKKAHGKQVKGIVISKSYDTGFESARRIVDSVNHLELSDVLAELGMKLN